LNKFVKLLKILKTQRYRQTFLKHGTAASVEHEDCMRNISLEMLVDVGANRGQFSTLVRQHFPGAQIVAFEPLKQPAARYSGIYAADPQVTLHQAALGVRAEERVMHVSGRDDSSSLLPITATQDQLFPGTSEVATESVRVAPLSDFLQGSAIRKPALLKIDVQGYELPVLEGCASLLPEFEMVYVECSFIELYQGQAMAHEVIAWLQARGFRLAGIYNLSSSGSGRSVQADFLFSSVPSAATA